jgi:transposase
MGTEEHLALRRQRSRPLFAKLLRWGHRYRGQHGPRSAMGKAIGYLLKHFRELGCFLRFSTIAPDNNKAEAALRRVAQGRSNYLFFGSQQAGEDFAILYTLVASAEKHALSPIAYLTDVLVRVHSHPAGRIDELLPHRWRPGPSPPRQ